MFELVASDLKKLMDHCNLTGDNSRNSVFHVDIVQVRVYMYNILYPSYIIVREYSY